MRNCICMISAIENEKLQRRKQFDVFTHKYADSWVPIKFSFFLYQIFLVESAQKFLKISKKTSIDSSIIDRFFPFQFYS